MGYKDLARKMVIKYRIRWAKILGKKVRLTTCNIDKKIPILCVTFWLKRVDEFWVNMSGLPFAVLPKIDLCPGYRTFAKNKVNCLQFLNILILTHRTNFRSDYNLFCRLQSVLMLLISSLIT